MPCKIEVKIKKYLLAAGLWLSFLVLVCGNVPAKEYEPGAFKSGDFLEVKAYRIFLEAEMGQPVIVMSDIVEKRGLLMRIGFPEANLIRSEMQGVHVQRPLTHDLLEEIIKRANFTLHRVTIDNIKEGIYHATIMMEREGSPVDIDARPSDSIILALKSKVPIFVSKNLFKEASVSLIEEDNEEEDYGLTIQELTPSLAKAFSFGSLEGVLVSDVLEGSPAERDGLKRGDIFVEIEGKAVADAMTLKNILETGKAPLKVKIFRKGRFLAFLIKKK